jgi:hypothetical protein
MFDLWEIIYYGRISRLLTNANTKILKDELRHYKESNRKLQFEIEKEKYFNGLTKRDNFYFKERNREFITQIEELKTKKQKMNKDLLQ